MILVTIALGVALVVGYSAWFTWAQPRAQSRAPYVVLGLGTLAFACVLTVARTVTLVGGP